MKMINSFTNQYSLSKTLRFSLIPIGKTEEHFEQHLLSDDEHRAESYKKVKKLIDAYHISFIEENLNKLYLIGLHKYAEIYLKANKSDEDIILMAKLEESMRKDISNQFTTSNKYKMIDKKELIEKDLLDFSSNDEDILLISEFKGFTTYFAGFNKNRQNMYSKEEKSTAISYRIVNENLPKFIDNSKSFRVIKENLSEDVFHSINNDIYPLYGIYVEDIFDIDYFNLALSQSGIEKYNGIIGGYTTSDGAKIKGLNEYINLQNQQDKSVKIPKLKILFKQILSDRQSVSYIPEKFSSDNEMLTVLREFFDEKNNPDEDSFQEAIKKIQILLSNIQNFNSQGVFVKNGLSITEISKLAFGDWSIIGKSINKEYDDIHSAKLHKDIEKYEDNRRKTLNRVASYSISKLQSLGDISSQERHSITDAIGVKIGELISSIEANYEEVKSLLNAPYSAEQNLIQDDVSISKIKCLLDSAKSLERFVGLFAGSGKETEKDNLFYGEYENLLSKINSLNLLYDKVRNYVTQKPYSTEKFKLNFGNPTFLLGWDKNKERNNLSIILRRGNAFYLAIMNKKSNKIFMNTPKISSDQSKYYEKMEYKLLPGPNKMLPKVFLSQKGIEKFSPSADILSSYAKGTHKKGDNFNIEDCHRLIDYFKDSINKHEDWG